ncbi:hypothetical protein A3K73_00250 [Candidatus Pacearchaeota archaeon RBG_13_36_9]|nr:MAG: hypothetical protein A3K73_00250 [Candidatus Pacearchaeota archaeon RBG_13_36_9]
MDKKDKDIIFELDKNSRLPYSKLAKLTGISQETARYRLNNLVRKGVIKKFMTVMDTAKLGYSIYQILLKLQNVNETKKLEVINFLVRNKNVAWVGDLEGNYDIAFIVRVRNQLELQNIIGEIHNLFSSYIMKKVVSVLLQGEFFSRDYLVNKKRTDSRASSYSPHEEIILLRDTDKKICQVLAEDARISYIKLSEKLKISPDSIIQHVKKLKKEGIIQKFTVSIDNEKMNQLHYKLLIYLTDFSNKKVDSLLSFIKSNNKVIAVIKTLAEWDYEIDLEIESIDQLKKFTMQLTSEYSDLIRDYELMRILSMPKYNFFE